MSDAEGTVELWGFHGDDIEAVREEVERALGVTMRLHESESIGPYFHGRLAEPEADLTLRPNLDPDADEDTDPDEALAEPDFPDHGVLLYVEHPAEAVPATGKLAALGAFGELLAVE